MLHLLQQCRTSTRDPNPCDMRTLLKRRGVRMVGGVEYVKIDDAGLQIIVEGKPRKARPRFFVGLADPNGAQLKAIRVVRRGRSPARRLRRN